ncbi:transposase [Bacillus toyonensis]
MGVVQEDETHIRDYQALHTSWLLRGKQKQISTYGRHASVMLFGAVKTSDGNLHCMEASACNATAFQELLRYVVKEQPTADIDLFTTLFTEFKFTGTYLEMVKRKRHL